MTDCSERAGKNPICGSTELVAEAGVCVSGLRTTSSRSQETWHPENRIDNLFKSELRPTQATEHCNGITMPKSNCVGYTKEVVAILQRFNEPTTCYRFFLLPEFRRRSSSKPLISVSTSSRAASFVDTSPTAVDLRLLMPSTTNSASVGVN